MIDNFALGLIHLLLATGVWRLLVRPDLDSDPEERLPPRAKPRDPSRTRR